VDELAAGMVASRLPLILDRDAVGPSKRARLVPVRCAGLIARINAFCRRTSRDVGGAAVPARQLNFERFDRINRRAP